MRMPRYKQMYPQYIDSKMRMCEEANNSADQFIKPEVSDQPQDLTPMLRRTMEDNNPSFSRDLEI